MIGERIRQRRKELGFSLRKLGARTDLTASFLCQVEHNQSFPSITSLQRIATALDAPVISLFDGARQPSPVVRAGKRQILDFQHSDVGYELITRADGRVMVVIIYMRPGGRCSAEQLAEHAEGLMYVLRGRLSITVDNMVHLLDPGDTIGYAGGSLREFAAASGEELQVICCITPPVPWFPERR